MAAFAIAPNLQKRVDEVAALSRRSPEEVVADALEHGQSLDWQKRFIEAVNAGLDDAKAGRFADLSDFERLRARYRRA